MKKITFLISILIASISCNSNDDVTSEISLPEATLIGANTFGAYANGILIIPRDGSGTFGSEDKGMRRYIGPTEDNIEYHEIRMNDFKSNRTSSMTIHFTQLDSLGIGEYTILESNCYEGAFNIQTNNLQCRIYNTDLNLYVSYCSIPNSGFINVSRFEDGYLSGTFYCKAANVEDPDDIIDITDGRFDTYAPTLPVTVFP